MRRPLYTAAQAAPARPCALPGGGEIVTATYQIVPVTDKTAWNSAVLAAPRADMLQSWEWGEFRREYGGWGVSRFVAMCDGEPLAGVQILSRRVSGVPF